MPAGGPASPRDPRAGHLVQKPLPGTGLQGCSGSRGGIMRAGGGMATDPAQARRDHPGRWPWRVAAKPRRPVHLALLVLICAGLVAYAWVDAGAAPFTRGALVGVVVPGALLSLIAVGR